MEHDSIYFCYTHHFPLASSLLLFILSLFLFLFFSFSLTLSLFSFSFSLSLFFSSSLLFSFLLLLYLFVVTSSRPHPSRTIRGLAAPHFRLHQTLFLFFTVESEPFSSNKIISSAVNDNTEESIRRSKKNEIGIHCICSKFSENFSFWVRTVNEPEIYSFVCIPFLS